MSINGFTSYPAPLRRVMFISEHDDPLADPGGVGKGGQNVYVREVAHRLAEYGWQVDVFTRRESATAPTIEPFGSAARVIRINAGPTEFVPKEQLVQYIPEFIANIMSICAHMNDPYELVHGHYYLSGVLARALQTGCDIPFIQTFHSLGAIKRRALGARDGSPDDRIATERAVADAADCIVATSPQERDDLATLYGVPPDKVRIIPCGVDMQRFLPIPPMPARAEWGLATDRLLIGFVGRIEPQKGIEVLLHAAAHLRELLPALPFQVVIVGGQVRERQVNGWGASSDSYTQSLEALSHTLGLDDHVVWTGALPHTALADIYSAADIIVIPSHYESFGMTALEALACGACVVASRTGGLQSTLDDGRIGPLFTPGSAPELGNTLALLACDDQLRAHFQGRARPYVTKTYGWGSIAAQLSDVYAEVIARMPQREIVVAQKRV